MSGEYLPAQVIYKGKTDHCHLKGDIPSGWDIWHSVNHWSNEETMLRYVEKIIVPFLNNGHLYTSTRNTQPFVFLTTFVDKWQQSSRTCSANTTLSMLQFRLTVLTNSNHSMLQSINPSKMRSEADFRVDMKWREQLKTQPVHEVAVHVSASVVKTRSLGWFVSSWQSLAARPTVATNGFKKTGIYDAVTKVSEL